MSAPVLDAVLRLRRGTLDLHLDLDAARDEVVVLLGPNGAGKSTALRALAGLESLDTGHVRLGDRVLDEPAQGTFVPPEQRPVAVVFQDHLLFPHLSVADNVGFAARSHGASKAASRTQSAAWLARLGLSELAGRRPRELSGGQAQRVALARALAADPELLLLDEPFASLDAGSRLDLRSDLREHLASFGGASVVVTHDPLDAMVLADRVVVVEAGRSVQTGTPGDLARRPATAYVAALMGLNLYRGRARDGEVSLADGGTIHAADAPEGDVLVAVRPEAVSMHLERPTGTPRNVWRGTVAGIELLGHRARVEVRGQPTALVDVTPGALAELRLVAGTAVWLSLKATEVEVYAQHAGGADGQQ